MKRVSFVKRFVALVLAAAIVLPNVNWSAFRVSAAEGDKTITAAELVAKNYELTEAEEDLLNSGYLVGDTYKYTLPSESDSELVTIDTDNKKISVKNHETWVPTTAAIVVDGVAVEKNIAIVDGKASYAYDGNMFSVEVTYTYNVEVANQETLLNAGADLSRGVAEAKAAYNGSDANLGTVAIAMDTMVQLADGIKVMSWLTFQFDTEAQNAVYELEAEMADNNNDGTLKLQEMNAAYANSTSKVQFLIENGEEYKAAIESTYKNLKAIAEDQKVTQNSNVDEYFAANDPASGTKWSAFKSILGSTVSALEPIANAADWNTDAVASGLSEAAYKELDTLVAAINTTTTATVVNPLLVATDVVKANASMYNVTVNVVLYTVNTVDSKELTAKEAVTEVLTLAENATPAEIVAAVNACGVVEEAKLAWGSAFVEEGYEKTVTKVTENLTKDIVYTIEFKPVDCDVTYGYVAEADAPTTVPYGYKMTLPKHANAEKAYDYTVNGEKQAQGFVITITKDTEIKRAEGKAYTAKTLYGVIADNVSSDKVASAILKSGALFGDEAVNVRIPDARDAEELLKLEGGQLTAGADYESNYEDLKWAPYTYGENGTESEFGGQTVVGWAANAVTVKYVLHLTNVDNAQEIVDLAIQLDQEAEGQIATLDRLAAYYDLMGQLDKTKLGAMNGVIDVQDDIDAATKAEMRATINKIINGHLEGTQLKIYKMIAEYRNEQGGGLMYYYNNSAAVMAEIDTLSTYITELMDNKEALQIVASAAGYGDYVEKIENIETALAEVKRDLKAPNAAIDLTSANLNKLVEALEMEGSASETLKLETPYIVSNGLKATDSSYKVINITIQVGNQDAIISSAEIERGTVIDQTVIDALESAIKVELDALTNNTGKYYARVLGEGSDTVVVGEPLDKNLNVVYVYTPVTYTVKIAGEADQEISVENLQITLPKNNNEGFRYDYTVDGKVYSTNSYKFTVEQLDRLFVDGVYTITRITVDEAAEKLEGAFDSASGNFYEIIKNADGKITGLVATVKGDQNGIMSFAMDLVNSGYSYIGLNGEDLMYLNAENTLEISAQTLINALLSDTTFGSQTLIELGQKNGGKLLFADMQLGDAANDIDFEALDFTLKLDGVPAQMLQVANGLDAIKNYMSFQSAGEYMDVSLNLPEEVYEAYLTALLVTGNIDKNDVNAIDNQIAFEFLYDYIELIIENEDVTATTFENTLKKLDNAVNKWTKYDVPNYNLSAYDKYYQMIRKVLTSENVVIETLPEHFGVSVKGAGDNILTMLDVLGIDISSYVDFVGMIKEVKAGGTLEGTVHAKLVNTSKNYEAALIDVRNDRFVDKADFTTDLVARLGEVEGAAVIVLLDDVTGDLTFDATTILDLNGKTLDGSITSHKNLIIVDSSLSNDEAGLVTGAISGTATIIGGYYDDPSAEMFVKDGYEIVNKQVQNVLYTVTGTNNDLAINLNSDILEENIDRYSVFAAELAADIAVDLVANYYTAATLNVLVDEDINQDDNFVAGWKQIYGFNFDDFVDLIQSDSIPTDLLNKGLASVSLPDLACVVNMITADLLDLDAIKSALVSGGTQAIASYSVQTAPWQVEIERAAEDYLTFGISGNEDLAKDITYSLYITGNNHIDELVKVVEYLDKIVVEENNETFFKLVDVEELTYADKHFNLTGGAEARVHLDLSDYTTAMAVIMAHGNPDKEAEIIDAIGNDVALKDIFDDFTVEEVFNAVKVLNRNDSLADIAAGYGIDMEPNKYLEKALILSLSAAGKALEKLEINGNGAKLGSLDLDDDGVYQFGPKTASKSGTITKRGYGVNLDLTTAEATLIIDLFGHECLWGDADHDGNVNAKDAALILSYAVGDITGTTTLTQVTAENICLVKTDVNDDGKSNAKDAALVLKYAVGDIDKFPVEE